MRLGFITACFPGDSLADVIKWAKDADFSSLEVCCWPSGSADREYAGINHIDVANLTSSKIREIKKLFKENRLDISALAYYPNNLEPDLKKREKIHAHLKKVIDAASALNVELVGTFVGRVPGLPIDDNLKIFAEVFPPLVKYAAEKKVKIMIENCPMMHEWPWGANFAYSPPIWERMFEIIPDENFGLNYDPSHLHWLGIDYIAPLKKFASRIFHAHAKDTEILPERLKKEGIYGTGWWRYRIPGLGDIDWDRFISALAESGFDGCVSIEHEDPVYSGSREMVKKGLILAKRHLERMII